jgi:hypothetical protein
MSVDQVREWVTTNDYFEGALVRQGKDLFVPDNARYPHVHIGTNFIVYSKSSGNHSYLIEKGGTIQQGRIHTAVQEETLQNKSAELIQLLRYMASQL